MFAQQKDGQILTVYPPLSNNHMTYNPMDSYLRWYTGKLEPTVNALSIAELDIEYKFWHRSHFVEWLEANELGTVLIQHNNLFWSLIFCESSSYQKFSNWWICAEKKTKIEVKGPSGKHKAERMTEILNWCKENLQHGWTNDSDFYSDKFTFRIENDEEAVQFKLTWIN